MMETERLFLRPLTYDHLLKYIKVRYSPETELNVDQSARKISPELKEAFELTILPNVADKSKDYLYSTLWTAVSKGDNKMVGDICITGEPSAEGAIEIGYGTYDEFQKRGFMTEAAAWLIKWAENQSKVFSIIASTNKDNIASFRILQKNNFVKIGEDEDLWHWKLILQK